MYQAGADPYKLDRLGSLKLSIEGLIGRDKILYDNAQARKIPIVAVLGGGYAQDTNDTVAIHSNLVKVFLGKL